MKYAFGDYTLDTTSEVLLSGAQRVEIEPKQYLTLLLFCQHPEQIISRDRLLQEIWGSTVVSENTINKHIAGIRKLLADDAKQPSFIETVPKKGYRFVASVNLVSNEDRAIAPKSAAENLPKGIVTLLFFSVAILMFWWNKDAPFVEDIQTLTRMEGNKRSISFFNNDKTILYINQRNNNSDLMVQHLVDGESHKVTHSFDSISHVTGMTGNDTVFVVANLFNKTWLSRGVISKGVYVSESKLDITPYRIWDLDYHEESENIYFVAQTASPLDRGLYKVSARFDQVESVFVPADNELLLSKVDTDPSQSTLLLLGQKPNSKSSVFSFDPHTLALKQLHEFGSLVREVIWHHGDLLYTDTPPAQRVLRIRPGTKEQPEVVATSSEYLCCEMLFSESEEKLIYRTNTTNYNIDWAQVSGWEIDNSTVYDMLPSLLHKKNGVVFVSKRTGKSQIYRQDKNGFTNRLSDFHRYRVVRWLDVSPDDKQVVAIVDNELLLFSTDGKVPVQKRIDADNSWLRDVNWLGNEFIVTKHRHKLATWLEVSDTALNPIARLPSEWLQLFSDQQSPAEFFAVHLQHGLVKLVINQSDQKFDLEIETILNHAFQSTGKILKDGEFFYQLANRRAIRQFDKQGQLQSQNEFRRLYGYDVFESRMIVSELKYQTSDWHSKRFRDQ